MRLVTLGAMLAVSAGLLLPATAARADLYGTSAPLTGVRGVKDPGLMTDDPDWSGVKVQWKIADNLDGTYGYTYTMWNFHKPSLSHFTLDISDNAVDDPYSVIDATLNGSPVTIELGDIDGIVGAVKFDDGAEGSPLVFSFTSNRSPVYGDLFVKGGRSCLQNTGFYDHGSMEALDFIARPDGDLTSVSVVPVPPSAALALIGLAPVGLLLRRRRPA